MKARIVLLMMVMPLWTLAQGPKNFIDQNFIEVRGQAVVKIVPDLIYLRIFLSERQKNHVDLEIKEKQMLESLKSIGIDLSKDMVVKDLASNFRIKMFSDDNIVISKAFLLCVHDAKTANKVISELEKLEISNVKVDHLDHTKMTDFRKECNIKAIVAAKAKAEYLTQALNQSVGRAIYIEENASAPVPYDNRGMSNVNYSGGLEKSFPSDSYLEFDEIKIESVVFARFELK